MAEKILGTRLARTSTIVLTALLVAPLAPTALLRAEPAQSERGQQRREAYRLHKEGRYAEALELFRALHDEGESGDPRIVVAIASSLRELGRPLEARPYYIRAIELMPTGPMRKAMEAKLRELQAAIDQITGRLKVTCALDDTTVKLGESARPCPHTFVELAPGTVLVQGFPRQGVETVKSVEIVAGRTTTVAFDFRVRLRLIDVDPDAEVFVDRRLEGRGPEVVLRPMKPGVYELTVRAPGKVDWTTSFEAHAGEDRSIAVGIMADEPSSAPPTPASSRAWGPWVVMGLGAAGVLTGGLLLNEAGARYDDAVDAAERHNSARDPMRVALARRDVEDAVEAGDRLRTGGYVSLGLGLTAAAAGLAWHIGANEALFTNFAMHAGPRGWAAMWTGRW